MKEPKRYYCGNGEGMFEDKKNGNWVEYSEHKAIVEELMQALRIHDVVGRSEQLKCRCKKAQFTRTVDADFNPLCGRCGKAL
jgi:hypothetical protein